MANQNPDEGNTAERERASDTEDAAAVHPTDDEERSKDDKDQTVDETSEDSYPASDPPSW